MKTPFSRHTAHPQRVLPGPRLWVQHPGERKMPESEKEEYQTLGASQHHTDKRTEDS